jgi:hypothetical protein
LLLLIHPPAVKRRRPNPLQVSSIIAQPVNELIEKEEPRGAGDDPLSEKRGAGRGLSRL